MYGWTTSGAVDEGKYARLYVTADVDYTGVDELEGQHCHLIFDALLDLLQPSDLKKTSG